MKNKLLKFLYPFICLLTAIIWGSGFPFQDMAGQIKPEPLDSFSFNGLRFLIAGIILIPVFLIFEKRSKNEAEDKPKTKKTVLFGILAGVILSFSSVLQQLGIMATGESGKAGFITGLYLIIVPIASFIFFKQKPSIFVFIAVPISLLGLFFLSISSGFKVQTGDIFVLACAFGFASHIILYDRVANKTLVIRLSCVQFFVASALCLLLGLIFGNISFDLIGKTIVPILYCGVFSAGVAYTLQLIGQKKTPPALASLLFATEGLFATIFECLFEKTTPAPRQILGCVLMLIAILLSQIPPRKTGKSTD